MISGTRRKTDGLLKGELRDAVKLCTEKKPSENLLYSLHMFNCHLWKQDTATTQLFLPNASGFMGEPIVCASLSQKHRAFHVPHPSAQGRQHLSVKEPEPEEEETTGRERLRPRKSRRAPALGEGQAAHHHTTKKIKGSGPQGTRRMCAFAAGKMLQCKNKQSCHRVRKAHSSCCSLLLGSEWARW